MRELSEQTWATGSLGPRTRAALLCTAVRLCGRFQLTPQSEVLSAASETGDGGFQQEEQGRGSICISNVTHLVTLSIPCHDICGNSPTSRKSQLEGGVEEAVREGVREEKMVALGTQKACVQFLAHIYQLYDHGQLI